MFPLKNFSARFQLGLLFVCISLSGLTWAYANSVDNSKSSISIVFKQMEVPVPAKFKKFTATIDYNSTKPETSKATVELDMTSLELPAPEYNQEVLKKEWFNSAAFPRASFVSNKMSMTAPGKLDVTGNLTIKGKTVATSFSLLIKQEGKATSFEGSLPIKRLMFNIGEGEWKDTSAVADEVIIKFKVVTNP
ncbi:MAG: YceI family protein [Undibacterium sp.]|nr:YceI family protein [Undibacterium sp.]